MGAPQNKAELELQDLGPDIEIKIGDCALNQEDIIVLLGLGGLADPTFPPCLSQSHFEALITGLTVLSDATPQTPGLNMPNSDDSRYMEPAPDLPITYTEDARLLGSPPLPFSNLSPAAMTCCDDSPAHVLPQECEYAMRMSSYTESC
ncbi:hypothetical protein SCP_0109430 [Sparassis crispa]|uniref:Uncharacterized protein n=1 Tax=Sparassis crispa TaxID=139825 RepID=A0A401G7B2_9APHY|nr:hypothetical protein SCP_0109430 [Sparassis crispa]GBE78061.1 hypothetical protein SCP_0109430 [Sparassis crispa]